MTNTVWNALDRHHQPKAIDAWIEEQRPKQILEYYDEAVKHMVRRFEARYGWKATV